MRFTVQHTFLKTAYLLGAALVQTACAHPLVLEPSVVIHSRSAYPQIVYPQALYPQTVYPQTPPPPPPAVFYPQQSVQGFAHSYPQVLVRPFGGYAPPVFRHPPSWGFGAEFGYGYPRHSGGRQERDGHGERGGRDGRDRHDRQKDPNDRRGNGHGHGHWR